MSPQTLMDQVGEEDHILRAALAMLDSSVQLARRAAGDDEVSLKLKRYLREMRQPLRAKRPLDEQSE